MKTKQITFAVAGLLAGLIVVAVKSVGSLEITIMSLTWFVGPLFFVATLAGIAMTGAWHCFYTGLLRYLTGLALCTITYSLALITFFTRYLAFHQIGLGFNRLRALLALVLTSG